MDPITGNKNAGTVSEKNKRSEEQDITRKNFYLSRFAHEIRTPINTISGFSQLLKEADIKKDNIRKYLDIITETTENLISLINYFNEIVEIETGEVSVLPDEIRLYLFVDEIFNRHYTDFREKNLHFEKKISLDTDLRIISDEAKLRQVLKVLISNALHYTFSGKVILGCEVRNDNVVFSVSDTGTGIPEDNKPAIFEIALPDASMVKRSKGSGLGLIIAKSYVEMMGGQIWFESTEGKGTDFHFSIPLEVSGKIKEKIKINPEMPVHSESTKKRILVAEDDSLNFLLIKSILSKLNVEILRAENGQEAVDIFSTSLIDLILMDVRMPVMDGYTAAKKIREMNSEVKIIAQTAYSNDKSIAISHGCNDFIPKPFSMNQLLAMVASYL